jgi:S1-C subfamily serine protease
MTRKIINSLFILSFTLFVLHSNCYALPRAVPETTKEAIVKKYLEGRNLNIVEGLWTWNVNGFNFEVAIINNKTEVLKEFEYLGIVTISDNSSHIGQAKMGIRSSSAKGVYPGAYILQYNDIWGTQQKYNTNFVMENDNLLSVILPFGYYGSPAKITLIRTYPNSATDTAKSSGTGFFISRNIVVTNYHVVEDARELEITYLGENKLPATVIAKDPSNDIALLKVSGLEGLVTPLPLGSVKDTKEGAAVSTVGFPMPTELGNRAKISEGIINSLTGIEDDIRMFQISIPIQPGNSGGPLLNNKGQVIGIVTSTLNNKYFLVKKGVVPQNVNFAMKINYVNNLLNILPEEVKISTTVSDIPLDTEKIMELAKKAVVFVAVKN